MKDNPIVTVIIPTYNRADKVIHAISSVLQQTYQPVEIIVVDDGSTDNTRSIVEKIPGVTYIYKDNGGQASARNEGLKNATGAIIASLDSDDIWYPHFLERCVGKLQTDNLDFVFANWDQMERNGQAWDFLSGDPFIKPYFNKMKDGWVNLDNEELRSIYVRACPSPSSSLIIRKASVANGWNTHIKIGDDWYMYLDVILSHPCKAAFTLDRLWQKTVDEINVFDGRRRNEVLENLYVADLDRIITTFKGKLTPEERKELYKIHVYSLVELSKHNLVREFNIPAACKLFGRALSIDVSHSFKSLQIISTLAMKRMMEKKK